MNCFHPFYIQKPAAFLRFVITLALLLLLFSVVYAQPELSQAEKDDLGFITNLFNDTIYVFAKQEAESFLDKYPESPLVPDVILIQAKINVIEGKFDLALRQYNKIIDQFPQSPLVESALYLSGTLKLQLNRTEGLIEFNRLITKFPQSAFLADVSYQKGELAFRNQQWQVAEFQFKQVLDSEGVTDEQRTNTQHKLAWIYYHTGKLLLAKSMFFDVLESHVNTEEKAKIAFQLGLEAQKSARYKNAISWFERQLSEWPSPEIRPKSRFHIAECYYLKFKDHPKQSTQQEQEKAVRLYTENLKAKTPISPAISRYHRGWLLIALNKNKSAEKDFSWLQKNSQKHAADLELTATRARYFEQNKNYTSANQVYINTLQYHKNSDIRNMLLISIIRNSHSLKSCQSIMKWKSQIRLAPNHKDAPEIGFYVGSCYFERKEWKKAGLEFSKIPLESQYARAVFPSYLQVFKKTKNFKGGMVYLEKVAKLKAYGNKKNILLYKIDLCLTLQRWVQGVDLMLLLKKQSPAKAKDAWYLLNIAKTADQVFSTYHKKKHLMWQHPAKPKKYYANLALKHYSSAYRYLPKKEKETRLSLLDILIARYHALGSHKKVLAYYRDALSLLKNDQRRVELRLIIAGILAKDLNQIKKAQSELYKIHNNGHSEAHFEASSLLADLYVGQKKYVQAIKILEDLAKQPINKTQWYATTHFRLGELYEFNQRWQKAHSHFKAVIKDNKNDSLVQQSKTRMAKIQKFLKE